MLGIKEVIPSKSVCRCLFGPVDHTEVKKTLIQEQKRLDDENSDRWNFDFKLETPISGKFAWVQLTTEDEVPEAYKLANLSVLAEVFIQSQAAKSRKEENTPSSKREHVESSQQTEMLESTPNAQERPSRKRKQCQITGKYTSFLVTPSYHAITIW